MAAQAAELKAIGMTADQARAIALRAFTKLDDGRIASTCNFKGKTELYDFFATNIAKKGFSLVAEYLKSVGELEGTKALIDLARSSSSDRVRLDAARELVGPKPDASGGSGAGPSDPRTSIYIGVPEPGGGVVIDGTTNGVGGAKTPGDSVGRPHPSRDNS